MAGREKLPPIRGRTAFLPLPDPERISLETLARLYLAGVRRIVAEPVRHGTTRSGIAEPLSEQIIRLNMLLTSRGLKGVVVKSAAPDALRAWQREVSGETAENPRRRGLLTRLATPVTEAAGGAADEAGGKTALSRLQGEDADRVGALFAHVPAISATRCTGCDACVTVCPRAALILRKDPADAVCYHSRAQECDGCGLCVEICDTSAVLLTEMAETPSDVLLEAYTCGDCGVDVHEPLGQAGANKLCRICRESGHRKKLFQVLT